MDGVNNFAFSRLATSLASGGLTFDVLAGQGARFTGTLPYNLVIYDGLYPSASEAYWAGKAEIVRATGLTTDTFTVTRAQESTTALDFTDTTKFYVVEQVITNAFLTSINPIPSQTGNNGKYLTTNGTTASWNSISHTHTVTYLSVLAVAEQFTNTSTTTIWLVPGFSSNLGNGHSGSSALSLPLGAGTIKNLRVGCSANTWTGGVNVTVYQASNMSTITCTLAQSVLTGNDLTHTLTLTEGQGIEFAVAASGSGSYSNLAISVEFERTVTSSSTL